jgi:Ino eighty subunit 2
VLKQTPKSGGKLSKPTLIVTPAPTGPLKSVEAKEADIDADGDEVGDDEELSELESDEEEEQEDNGVGGDAEGEEEDMEEEEDADGDDVDIDIDSEGTTPGSGAATPDLAKMTKRQRRDDEGFMALDMAPQVCLTLRVRDYFSSPTVYQIKKHFTQEEQNMRRSEMARRRKNLSEKKVMEEKESTINKLLKKQTSKVGLPQTPSMLILINYAAARSQC